MKIRRLLLENYRCFEKLELTLHDNLNVLVALNGGGKTAVLDAIAVALGPYVGAFDEGKGVGFFPSDIRIVPRGTNNEMELQTPISLTTEWEILERKVECNRLLAGKKNKTTVAGSNALINHGKMLQKDVRDGRVCDLPLVGYYGTGRLWNILNRTESQTSRSRTAAYANCLNPNSSFKSFSDWFVRTSMAEMIWDKQNRIKKSDDIMPEEQNPHSKLLRAVRSSLDIVLERTGWHTILWDDNLEIIMHHSQYGSLPVRCLSDGLRNVIGLVADIAHRAVRLNAFIGRAAGIGTSGIVLIDEIDLHLHPSWQQTILGDLRAAFPKIQFIVTTHSPQVLTSVPAECIRELVWEGGAVAVRTPEFSLGAESPQLLESIQGVNPRPQHLDIVGKLNRYLELVSQDVWDGEEALGLRQELDAWGHGHEPALAKADIDIRLRRYQRTQRRNQEPAA